MQSKIRAGAINEVGFIFDIGSLFLIVRILRAFLLASLSYHLNVFDHVLQYKKEVEMMLEMAQSCIRSHFSSSETDKASSSPIVTPDSS